MSTLLTDTVYDAAVIRDTIALSLKIVAHTYRKLADEAATARINLMGITPIGGTNPDELDLRRADRLGSELFAICLRFMESEARMPFQIHSLLRDCDREHRLSDYVEAERQVRDALKGLLPRAQVAKW